MVFDHNYTNLNNNFKIGRYLYYSRGDDYKLQIW